jgi:hypothetical protein
MWLFEYDPWKQQLGVNRNAIRIKWASTVRKWIVGGAIVVVLSIGACFTTPGYIRLAPIIWIIALIGLAVAWRTPTFAKPEIRAPVSLVPGDLCCGVPTVNPKGESVSSSVAHIVSQVIVTGTSPDDAVWLAFADGDALAVPRGQGVGVSHPEDVFARLRPMRRPFSSVPEMPSEATLVALRAMRRLTDGGVGTLSIHRLQQELAWGTEAIESFIVEANRLRVVLNAGVDRQHLGYSSVAMTRAGVLAAIASEPVDMVADMPDPQKSEQPQPHGPVILNNYGGVINYASPGAAGNVGSGSAAVTFTIEVRDSLLALANAVPTIIARVDKAHAGALTNAADEIRRGLQDPVQSQDMLRKAVALIASVGGELVVSILGSAAWDAAKAWLGL